MRLKTQCYLTKGNENGKDHDFGVHDGWCKVQTETYSVIVSSPELNSEIRSDLAHLSG